MGEVNPQHVPWESIVFRRGG